MLEQSIFKHIKDMNFNRKYIYTVPCICMYCKVCYKVKEGFNGPYPSHGICPDCAPEIRAKGGLNENTNWLY